MGGRLVVRGIKVDCFRVGVDVLQEVDDDADGAGGGGRVKDLLGARDGADVAGVKEEGRKGGG